MPKSPDVRTYIRALAVLRPNHSQTSANNSAVSPLHSFSALFAQIHIAWNVHLSQFPRLDCNSNLTEGQCMWAADQILACYTLSCYQWLKKLFCISLVRTENKLGSASKQIRSMKVQKQVDLMYWWWHTDLVVAENIWVLQESSQY